MDRLHQILDGKPSDALALIDHDGTRVSYGDLRLEVSALAAILKNHGVRGGDRVVLVSENSVLFAAMVFAASALNAWLILVNARQSADEIAAIEAHATPRCVVFTHDVSAPARDHAARMEATKIGALASGAVWATKVRDVDVEPVDADDNQVAVLLYTTGTTSAPKGVMLTHKNLLFCSGYSAQFNRLVPEDRVVGVLPGTHIYALSSVFLPAMTAGASLEFVPRFDVPKVLSMLRGGATRFPAVPQMFAAIMQHLDEAGEDLNAPSLVNLVTGGAPLDPGLKARVEKVFGLPLNNGYGMTETSPSISSTHNDHPREDVGVGVPYDWIDVRIWEPNKDGVGEIQVRGDNVMRGYYRAPDKTAEVMTKDGFFRTGDLGRFDEGGGLHVVGRSKELIIRSGFNVYPPEIEAMLSKHPNVYQVAVIGRQVPGNEEILAFVKVTGDVGEDALKAWLKDRLVAYKVPSHVFVVDAYPAAATGKILKHKLLGHFADLIAERDS
ncbi:class I adenylate-forming enzyme family protein [Amylibacter sp. IMCC11727]|uniref:class I adenylate-forming enzyme family protein n=1 Tax=Amylibacter sp. IMCC11727 TaxID=3039851 RepID=UPI00244E53D1|nr:class I adenylate-forming enzyme family protein [Amylibacter sp. IMCC11727]WGI23198.1 class I adenylate-forming enzyme family protein [Amylibacter sp. IMCC11727]